MEKINLLIIAGVVIIFISLLLAFFLLTVKTTYKISNYLFSALLILTTIDVSGFLFDSFIETPSNIGMFKNLVTFLQIPVFYSYVVSVCYSDFKLRSRHLLHLIPFVVANLILLPRYYLVDVASKISFLQNHQDMFELMFNHVLLHIQIFAYLVAAFMLLKKAKKLYLENHAGASISAYNWLFQFTIAITAFYSIALLKNIFKFSDYPNISEWMIIGLFLFQLLVITWYLFKALNNPGLFRNVDSKLKLVADIITEEQNSVITEGNEEDYEEELARLKDYMIQQKPFLNSSLTIQDISDELEITVRELSLLINHRLGQHFFDFINSYRIEQAMAILQNKEKSKVTILEILYEVGFNSKSSFNTAFKKHAGVTPTAYRKSLMERGL